MRRQLPASATPPPDAAGSTHVLCGAYLLGAAHRTRHLAHAAGAASVGGGCLGAYLRGRSAAVGRRG